MTPRETALDVVSNGHSPRGAVKLSKIRPPDLALICLNGLHLRALYDSYKALIRSFGPPAYRLW